MSWGGIMAMMGWHSPEVAFDPKYPTRGSPLPHMGSTIAIGPYVVKKNSTAVCFSRRGTPLRPPYLDNVAGGG